MSILILNINAGFILSVFRINYSELYYYRIFPISIINIEYVSESESYIVFVILPINYFDILLLFRILSEILLITDFNM